MKILSILCAVFVITAPMAATACNAKRVRGSDAVINPEKINANLMSKAILAYTNQARCEAGRSNLKHNRALTEAATIHSIWMGNSRKMVHNSNIRKQRDLGARLKLTGAKFRVTAAENIGKLSRMAFPRGVAFRIKDASSCQFTWNNGAPINPQTYDSLAREIVGLWMASPSHRANIMIAQVKRHGAMIGFDRKGPHCGDYFVTQVFAG